MARDGGVLGAREGAREERWEEGREGTPPDRPKMVIRLAATSSKFFLGGAAGAWLGTVVVGMGVGVTVVVAAGAVVDGTACAEQEAAGAVKVTEDIEVVDLLENAARCSWKEG